MLEVTAFSLLVGASDSHADGPGFSSHLERAGANRRGYTDFDHYFTIMIIFQQRELEYFREKIKTLNQAGHYWKIYLSY